MSSSPSEASSQLKEDADAFLAIAHEFKLGSLPTESPNSKTKKLSSWSKNQIESAFEAFKSVDSDMLKVLLSKSEDLAQLKLSIVDTLKNNGRIFLCGCGATGRLSLAIETLWRMEKAKDLNLQERVISFMAGGDVALIHSIEKFEDFPEFGARQLRENNFKDNDLLIATTEGGETPWVIGATICASQISKRKPYFIYCNPDDVLSSVATRSKNIINDSNILKINLTVGPMALTGSTRLQASTVLMAFVGFALFYSDKSNEELLKNIEKLKNYQHGFDYAQIKELTIAEADHYKNGGTILYDTISRWAISILTDTTERSPTFSLYSFENQHDENKSPSLVYLYMNEEKSASEAWVSLLKRKPRTFVWPEVTALTGPKRIEGFQFHKELYDLRKKYLSKPDTIFSITGNDQLNLSFKGIDRNIDLSSLDFLSQHLMLKMILNAHSTIIMGRLGRYEGNLMTWVRPSNFKLIDRAVRYASFLLAEKGINVSYEKLVRDCYELKDQISRNDPIVLKIVEKNA